MVKELSGGQPPLPIPAWVTLGESVEGTRVGLNVWALGPAGPLMRRTLGSVPFPTRSQELSRVSILGSCPRPSTFRPSLLGFKSLESGRKICHGFTATNRHDDGDGDDDSIMRSSTVTAAVKAGVYWAWTEPRPTAGHRLVPHKDLQHGRTS